MKPHITAFNKFLFIILSLFMINSFAENKNWIAQAPRDYGASSIDNANSLHDYLRDNATQIKVDQDHSGYSAIYVYTMPDGQVIECERGIVEGEFFNYCSVNK